MKDAIAACRASVAASPTCAPDPDLTEAVVAALGPCGRVLDAEETAIVIALRPELRGPLVAPVDAGFIAPAVLRQRRLDRLIELDAPEVIIVRAIVLAHDLATETDARVEQNEPHDLARWATEQHAPDRDPAEVNREFFTWWLDEAVQAARRAA